MPCYIIAEAGVAHEGSLVGARTLLNTASAAGADAFKIQYFEKGMKGRNGTELPWLCEDDVSELARDCKARGLDFIITPHDEWALNFIFTSKICNWIKIGSGDWHLFRSINNRRGPRIPLIISTGMHTDAEIKNMIRSMGAIPITVLHCISEYPTDPSSARLWYMKQLMEEFSHIGIGYSDHTIGTAIPLAAVAMGAQFIEKHISTERNIPGRTDSFVSLTHKDFIQFVKDVRTIECAISKPSVRGLTSGEQETKEWVMKSRGLTLDTWR